MKSLVSNTDRECQTIYIIYIGESKLKKVEIKSSIAFVLVI